MYSTPTVSERGPRVAVCSGTMFYNVSTNYVTELYDIVLLAIAVGLIIKNFIGERARLEITHARTAEVAARQRRQKYDDG